METTKALHTYGLRRFHAFNAAISTRVLKMMPTQLLTSYSKVVSSSDKGSNGSSNSSGRISASTFFDDKDDVTAIDYSMTDTLAFKYEFKVEREALRDYEQWQKTVRNKEQQAETVKQLLGNKRSDAEPSSSTANSQGFSVQNIIPTVTTTLESTVDTIRGTVFSNNNQAKQDTAKKSSHEPDVDVAKVLQFREYTGATEAKAIEYLRSFDWVVDTAVKHYFEQ